MAKKPKDVADYKDLTLDPHNANKGTKRGLDLLDRSLDQYGAGRSGLMSADGVVLAGNKTIERAMEKGIPIKVVRTDGRELVIVQRTDLDYDDPRARELALADNRVAQIDLDWDTAELASLAANGMKLGDFFTPEELVGMGIEAVDLMPPGAGAGGSPEETEPPVEGVDNRPFSLEQIEAAIHESFPAPKSSEDVAAGLISIPQAMGQFNKLASGQSNTGLYISALFNPHRINTPTVRSKGYVDMTRDKNFRKQGARWLAKWYQGDIPLSHYLKYSMMGWGGSQFCNEFRPWVARDIYKAYCKPGAQVLDPSHGWGGRLVGWFAANLGGHYLGFDPAKRTSAGAKELIAFLKTAKVKSTAEIKCAPFESAKLKPGSIDFAFTSPPYFDTEDYGDDPGQAGKGAKSYEEFVAGFLTQLIVVTMKALKKGSIFLLNVGESRFPMPDDAIKIAEANGYAAERQDNFEFGRTGDSLGLEGESKRPPERFVIIRKP